MPPSPLIVFPLVGVAVCGPLIEYLIGRRRDAEAFAERERRFVIRHYCALAPLVVVTVGSTFLARAVESREPTTVFLHGLLVILLTIVMLAAAIWAFARFIASGRRLRNERMNPRCGCGHDAKGDVAGTGSEHRELTPPKE